MLRDLRLAYEPCGMTEEDQMVSVTICLVPFDKILPAAAGLFRAHRGPAALTEGVGEGPQALYRRAQAKAEATSRRTGAWVLPFWPLVLSEPEANSGVTVIEDHGNQWIAAAIARFRAGTTVLSIRSRIDRAVGEEHAFALRRGARVLRQVSSIQDDQGRWQVTQTGKMTDWETGLRGQDADGPLDRAALFEIARAAGVDLQACLARRKLRRGAEVRAIDERDPDDASLPTRTGQAFYEEALRAGLGGGEDTGLLPAREARDLETLDVAALELEVRRAISRARTVEGIRSALNAAHTLMTAGPGGRLRLGALYSLGVARAYRIDLDGLTTRRMEREWCDTMAGTDLPVGREDIETDRLKARRSQVLRPLARRHEAMTAAARTPADLLPILHDVCTDPLPEVDAKFCEMALQLALKRARELDPHSADTIAIADALETVQRPEHGPTALERPDSGARTLRRQRLAVGARR